MDLKELANSRQQRITDAIVRKIKTEPVAMAAHIGIPHGVKAISSAEERKAYWTADPEVMANYEMYVNQSALAAHQNAKPDEDPSVTEQRARVIFANKLYPARMDLTRSGARGLSVAEQIKFADHMAELGPPKGDE